MTQGSWISVPEGLWLQGEILPQEDVLGLSQECGVLLKKKKKRAPPSLLRLLKLFSVSVCVSWCSRACPFPEAKPIQAKGLADHARFLSSMNRFKQALFSSEP